MANATLDPTPCGAKGYDDTQNTCTRKRGHLGRHRCSAADVDARRTTTVETPDPTAGPLGFEAINLDDATTDPAELDALGRVLTILAAYADRKAGAMRCRIAGNITKAVELEASCERLFDRLPEWARW